jgi:hypothetical protein
MSLTTAINGIKTSVASIRLALQELGVPDSGGKPIQDSTKLADLADAITLIMNISPNKTEIQLDAKQSHTVQVGYNPTEYKVIASGSGIDPSKTTVEPQHVLEGITFYDKTGVWNTGIIHPFSEYTLTLNVNESINYVDKNGDDSLVATKDEGLIVGYYEACKIDFTRIENALKNI